MPCTVNTHPLAFCGSRSPSCGWEHICERLGVTTLASVPRTSPHVFGPSSNKGGSQLCLVDAMAMLYPGADVTPHAAFILGSGLALGGLPESQQKVKSHTYRCGIWSIDTVQSSVQCSAARDRLMRRSLITPLPPKLLKVMGMISSWLTSWGFGMQTLSSPCKRENFVIAAFGLSRAMAVLT